MVKHKVKGILRKKKSPLALDCLFCIFTIDAVPETQEKIF